MALTKPSRLLTFRDLLSHLSFERACKLLGSEGRGAIQRGGKFEVNLREDVRFTADELRVSIPDSEGNVEATLKHDQAARGQLTWGCSKCFKVCDHVGCVVSLVLDNKTALGLAKAPPEQEPVASLSDEAIVERAIAERWERASTERMKIKSENRETPWGDYLVTSTLSGKSYGVSLRGLQPGQSHCTCPDFRTNTLGTCKHIMRVGAIVKRKFTAEQLKSRFRQKQIEVLLDYGRDVTLRVAMPDKLPADVAEVMEPFRDKVNPPLRKLLNALGKLEGLAREFVVWPDAEEFIQQRLHVERLRDKVAEIRKDPAAHPLRTTLLKTKLLPYQLEGIAFVVGAGRAVLADDMGLGKTIQGVGVAELLAREAGIRRTLVICPASLKSQWRGEINRFCDRTSQLIDGPVAQRETQYSGDVFFTICNYEQVLKDILAIEQVPWDLIILDEGQRIKNWEAKTSRVVKGLKSRFALVLSGTPLENRLEDLYSVVQFIDNRRLGPGFRFFNEHRQLSETGKLVGYQNLDQLRERLKPILLRRTRTSVRLELPERTTEVVRIPPTDEQKSMHDAHMQTVASIVAKKFLTEMDLLRLRMALLMWRMSANGTFLVNKEKPNWSSKLERLTGLIEELAAEADRKVVLFSEWTTMLDLIEPLLKATGVEFVRLDGSVPQKKRPELVHAFQNDPQCRFFLSTNAGSTGLNLQAGNTLINVDLPWNPAILEQRIGRIHRMGQQRPVQVYILVTENTLEEQLLATLSAKKDLALAALDAESTVDQVKMITGTDDIKARLEVLLGAKPEAYLDKTKERDEREELHRRQRVAVAGGEMFTSVFRFLGEMVGQNSSSAPPDELIQQFRSRLDGCVQTNDAGQPQLTITLPDASALDGLAKTLASFLAVK